MRDRFLTLDRAVASEKLASIGDNPPISTRLNYSFVSRTMVLRRFLTSGFYLGEYVLRGMYTHARAQTHTYVAQHIHVVSRIFIKYRIESQIYYDI